MTLRVVLLLAILTGVAPAQQITVSPTGPIRTLAEARDAARAERHAGVTGTITITVRAGIYFLPETLVLTPGDSDTIWQAFRGEHPVISGGRVISGWTKTSGAAWTAAAPGPYFHQLFVDGARASRPRTPATGFFRFDGGSTPFQQLRFHYRDDDIKPQWASEPDAEVVGVLAWNDFRSPIVSIDASSHLVALDAKEGFSKEADAQYFVENLSEALTAPGQWYLDRATHTVSYIPLPGQDVSHLQVIASTLERLIELEGKPEANELVRNVVFRGLTFAYTEWVPGPTNLFDGQGASKLPAAVSAVGAVNFHVEYCLFAHLGGYGLELGRGSQHNEVSASEFYDLGGGGIKVGEPALRTDAAEQNQDNLIADNLIHHIGQVFASGMGILVQQSVRNRILHNDVHDAFQTGISVGWTWGYGPSFAEQNLIAYNRIYDIGQNLTSDMGGIYTLGIQPGTVIQNNLIHDVSSFTYGGWGIYLDEGSSHILVQNNIVYHCKSAGFHENTGADNLLRNNIFAFNFEHSLMRTKFEPDHLSFGLQNNIIYFDQGTVLGGNWASGGYVLRDNLYYDTRSSDVLFLNKPFAQWQASGQDQGSRIANPDFVDAAKFDFRLRPDSPALKMGFHPIDVSTVGPRVPAGVSTW